MTGWYLRSCLVQNRRCAGFEIWHDNKDQASICVLIKCARHCLAAACSRNPVIIRKRSSLSSPIICPPHPLDSRSSSTSTKAPYLDALHRCSLSCDPTQGQASDPTPPASARNTASDPPPRWLHRTAARLQSSKQKVPTTGMHESVSFPFFSIYYSKSVDPCLTLIL